MHAPVRHREGPLRARILVHAACVLLFASLAVDCASPERAAREARRARELNDARRATHEARWKEAAGLWQEIFLRRDENSREACAETARALIELGDPVSAQHLVELGLKTFPGDSEFYELKALALAAQGFSRAAETAYENALRFAPGDDRLTFALADLRGEIGLNESALRLLQPKLDSGTASAREFALAGKLQRALKQPSQAYLSFDRAFKLSAPSEEQLLYAASMYADETVRKKDARAAVLSTEWANRALAIDPQATAAHFILGMLAEDAQRDSQAAACYRRAVETDPACVPALTALATVQERRGELQDAMAIAERALALEKDPAKRAELERLAHPPPRDG